MLWSCFLIILVITFPFYLTSAESGTVELNQYTFDKIINKFEATLVKFDVAFPFGDKHDAFVALSKEAREVNDLLFAEVGIKDYGERENEKLAKKYGATKENLPVVKLFLKNKSEPIAFDGMKTFTSDDLRRFVRENSGIYLSLPGCIKSLDLMSIKFKNAVKEDRENIFKETQNIIEKLDSKDAAVGNMYKIIMQKILEKGDDFITAEISRTNKLLTGKLSDNKKKELASKRNILQTFTFSTYLKDEL